jgi:hypothetical protein
VKVGKNGEISNVAGCFIEGVDCGKSDGMEVRTSYNCLFLAAYKPL